MILRKNASFAERVLKSINTVKRDFAVDHAQIEDVNSTKIKSIDFIGVEDVYNMEVDGTENYSVNGGYIIHNCIDSLRYNVEQYRGKSNKKENADELKQLRSLF